MARRDRVQGRHGLSKRVVGTEHEGQAGHRVHEDRPRDTPVDSTTPTGSAVEFVFDVDAVPPVSVGSPHLAC